MKAFRITLVCLLVVCSAAVAQDDWPTKQRLLIRVIDDEGDPVEGATVLAARVVEYAPCALEQVTTGRTNAQGKRHITRNQSRQDRLHVLVTKDGFAYGWGTLDPDCAAILTVCLGKPSTLSGTVVDETGEPIADATVRLRARYANSHRKCNGSSPEDFRWSPVVEALSWPVV